MAANYSGYITFDSFKIKLNCGDRLLLIPHKSTYKKLCHVLPIDLIIIVEKEAVFNCFLSFLSKQNSAVKMLLISGKGFPDTATLDMLYTLGEKLDSVPLLAIVDADIYGMRIFWNYFGKLKSVFSQIAYAGVFLLDFREGNLTISKREWNLLRIFLMDVWSQTSNAVEQHHDCLRLLRREITREMLLFAKAEINALPGESDTTGFNLYIFDKLATSRTR